MVESVGMISIKHVILEYYRNQEVILIFNTWNKRYLEVNEDTLTYIKNYENELESNDALENYLFKKKLNILNLKILNLKIDSKIFFSINKFFVQLFNRYVCFLLILISVVTMPIIAIKVPAINIQDFSIGYLGVMFISQFFIILIHEMGHYQEYMKYFKRNKIYCGLQLRYFCLLLFYIDVSFLRVLSKRDKIQVIIAGVRNQFILNGILSLIYLLTFNTGVLLVILINLSIIVFNLMPFMKLDGFWLVNVLIGTQNYMKNFRAMLTGKEPLKKSIVIWGVFNSVAILITILVSIINFYQNYILYK